MHYLALGLFLLVVGAYYAVPLWDSDFWWHIASGREILQNGLPDVDPFGVFPPDDAVRNDTVLKGQWLGQVVLYSLFEAGGLNAVVAFRVLVLLTCLWMLYLRGRWLGANALALWLVLIVVALNLGEFGGERPQLLSFLFASMLFVLVDRAEHRPRRELLLVPVVVMLWANSHGGVILGVVLLALWAGIKCVERGTSTRHKLLWVAVAGASFLASLLTPNGFQTYLYLLDLEGSVLQSRTSEYVSTFQLYTLGHVWAQTWALAYFLLAAVGAVALLHLRQWRWLAIVSFLAAISAMSVRYLVFFLFLAGPYLMLALNSPLKRAPISFMARWGNGLLCVVLVAVLIVGVVRGMVFQGGLYQPAYPVAIADFVKQRGLQGRVFNNLEWLSAMAVDANGDTLHRRAHVRPGSLRTLHPHVVGDGSGPAVV
ncbi:MAG: hypothetical protein GXP17_10355 [Gammaproteobacteria bacterium]|nr:hypothetical protein [Gammaproteobacteria bacterium]